MLPERPITRVETYLARLAGQDVAIPETPITRLECYLHYLCEHGGGGGGGDDAVVYGFHINGSDPDPETAVTYLRDAVGKTPAHMDYTTGEFDYGGWADAFFMPRPCMLRYDGTVAYYLDPDDYTKKADGTASDVGDPTFAGNAMMEWGRNGNRIWYKIVPDAGDPSSASVYISDQQKDTGYHAWSFMDEDGALGSHFYTAIYNGSEIVEDTLTRLRSLSGQSVCNKRAGNFEVQWALANNPDSDVQWYTEVLADRILINLLLILIGKSLDTQSVFGEGLTSGGESAMLAYRTGAGDARGLFWGSSEATDPVKIFGMENYWGLQWRRTAGLIMSAGLFKWKLTQGTQDGSTATGYNSDGTGYVDTDITLTGTSGDYISRMRFSDEVLLTSGMGGTSSTHYCDGQWFNLSGNRYGLFGGSASIGKKSGAFACYTADNLGNVTWAFGTALSCKPKGA